MLSIQDSALENVFNRSFRLKMILLAISVICLSSSFPQSASGESISILDKSVETQVRGSELASEWKVNNKTFQGFALRGCYVKVDVKGYDAFNGYIGFADSNSKKFDSRKCCIVIEVDGHVVKQLFQKAATDATFIDIPLTGKSTLGIKRTDGSLDILLINPTLIKGKSTSTEASSSQMPGNSTGNVNNQQQASFVIDPNDLDKLAEKLRKRVDAKPEIQQQLVKGNIALMTFNLIDIPSPSVAQNVAEDLSTRMINADFNLVERGQLDKALKELKIQNSGLIDQATAQKLGQITGCNFILVGSVSDRGQFLVMNSRILETATGKAVVAESVECRKIDIKR